MARRAIAGLLLAGQIAEARRLAHVLPSARFPRLEDRLDEVDYDGRAIAENLASGDRKAADVAARWMRSPVHRTNMLDARYVDLGVGHAVDARGRPYYVQVFAKAD